MACDREVLPVPETICFGVDTRGSLPIHIFLLRPTYSTLRYVSGIYTSFDLISIPIIGHMFQLYIPMPPSAKVNKSPIASTTTQTMRNEKCRQLTIIIYYFQKIRLFSSSLFRSTFHFNGKTCDYKLNACNPKSPTATVSSQNSLYTNIALRQQLS